MGLKNIMNNEVEKAMSYYLKAIQTNALPPEGVGAILSNLGQKYEQNQNVSEAIALFQAALKIFTPKTFPQLCLDFGNKLGEIAMATKQWSIAIQGFSVAIEAIEQSYATTLAKINRQNLMEVNITIYRNIVQACIFNRQLEQAIEYVERSKARELLKILTSRHIHPQLSNDISFSDIQALLDQKTAILQWYIVGDVFQVFMITNQIPSIRVWQSTPEKRAILISEFIRYLEFQPQPAKKQELLLPEILSNLMESLHLKELLEKVPQNCDRVILVPHRFLHLLPLHALPLPNQQNKSLLDRFPRGVCYAPSCQLLQQVQQQRPYFSDFFAVQNPEDNLPYADLEVKVIRAFFSTNQVLEKQAATKVALTDNQNLSSVHCSHFSCHGTFNLESPLKSALKLANGEQLTLEDLFGLSLNQCRLVTLSACETGLTDPTSISDEYVGLPNGFLYAGSTNVVSSLWKVNDISSTFLMIKFYQNLKENQSSVAKALNGAQRWLRDATQQELAQWANKLNLDEDNIEKVNEKLDWYDPDEKPFNDPYHWAAFCAIGQ